jgi:hypothetical protein
MDFNKVTPMTAVVPFTPSPLAVPENGGKQFSPTECVQQKDYRSSDARTGGDLLSLAGDRTANVRLNVTAANAIPALWRRGGCLYHDSAAADGVGKTTRRRK